MDLSSFEIQLRDLLGASTTLRPFVCDGNPLTCRAFIVGTNPATSLANDFWSFWNSESGFQSELWLERYREARAVQTTATGRRKRPVSNTRQRMEWLAAEAAPVRILETNLYATATASAAELSASHRQAHVFRWLLSTIRPKVIVAHGCEAWRAVDELDVDAEVLKVKHLSRASRACAVSTGREVRHLVFDDNRG
jgi:hypothetical protein